MGAELIHRRDLDFLLYDWLGVERLFDRARFHDHSRDTTEALLDLSAELAERYFLAHYKLPDRVEPTLGADSVQVTPEIREAIDAFTEAGFMAAPFAAELGGLQLPYVLHSASMAQFMAANVGVAAYAMLTMASANLLATFGTAAQINAFASPQLDGRALGTMCLSEPQAGSSLADIATRAEPDGEDDLGRRFRLFGTKMWISGGDHDLTPDIVHLVLAKVRDESGRLPAGTKGLSLFVTPRWLPGSRERNDVVVAGLNHKMGYRATTNCLLNFGEGAMHRPHGAAGAVGYLVGEVGQGLPIMFHMMNEARIAVGLGAAALGYRGYRLSLAYAQERTQGRPAEVRDPASPPVPLIRHPDVKRMLMQQKAYAEGALALTLYCAMLVDEEASAATPIEREAAGELLGLLTPIAKTWPSEWGLAANDLAIQIHGGYGYTRDFDVEQLYRDNRLNPIHEGATGIQGADLMGRKILRDRGRSLARLQAAVEATAARAEASPDLSPLARQLADVWGDVAATAGPLIAAGDLPRALWNATPFLRALGHAVVGWIWLDQAVAALRLAADDPLREGKLRACRFFFEQELPLVAPWLAVVRAGADTAAAMPVEAF